ncbi:dynein light chain roadblock-type 2-like isoform X1 [Pieris brassicae]|uniref:dynein light chain roadblock-type 2-like isoform X1 n=1 Tax=Pieris brassicae TaxID=7116 RepID=UPI001E661D7D|nr:dynein light chain roadblock-type 2-like isoform X1 [Pieris brassicae]
MSHTVKRKLPDIEMPAEFSTHTIGAINRIEERPNVMGIMYFRNGFLQLTTAPETLSHILTSKLPPMTSAFRRAISEITASLNEINPIVDRIMEDESVEGVIMTNQEGEPILTNINLMNATNYGIAMRRLGAITQASIKDLDPFDEVLILRVTTKKLEIMTAPHSEFNVIVMQHSRIKSKHKNK